MVLGAINALNVDVTSIESARSRGEILEAIDPGACPRGIGPGLWDIHSPRVRSAEEIADQLRRARAVVRTAQLWVNPACALKTRGYVETEASPHHLAQPPAWGASSRASWPHTAGYGLLNCGVRTVEKDGAISRAEDLPIETRPRPVGLQDGPEIWVATKLKCTAPEALMGFLLGAAPGLGVRVMRDGQLFLP